MATITMDGLYRDHRTLLLSVAYRMTSSRAEAEDIVQDVFAGMTGTDWTAVENPRAYCPAVRPIAP